MKRAGLILVGFVLLMTLMASGAPEAHGQGAEPDTTLSSPGTGAVVGSPVTLSGTTSDDTAVSQVRVAVRDLTSRLWLRPDGSFGGFALNSATVENPGELTSDWTWTTPLPAGRYAINVRSIDQSGVVETSKPYIRITVVDGGAPYTTVAFPQPGVATGSPVTLSGTTVADTAVGEVFVAIRDRTTGLWLRPDGSFAGFYLHSAPLASPDAASSDWSWTTDLPPGSYGASVRSVDAFGVEEVSRPFVVFRVEAPTTDVEPDASVAVPSANQQLPGPTELAGTAVDDSGVAFVRLSIRDRDSLDWLQNDGSFQPGFALLNASLATPNAPQTDWSFPLDVPAGSYFVIVRAVDDAGLVDSTKPWVPFTVANSAAPPVTFRAIADTPYNPAELAEMVAQLPNLNADEEFVVHLGDIKSGSDTGCEESYYQTTSDALLSAPVPAYIIPGDNEWNDCADMNAAWAYWDQYFGDFEENFPAGPTVLRQDVRTENFAFIQSGVAFIGINRVGNQQPGQANWGQIDADNAAWVSEILSGPGMTTSSAVIFGHGHPKFSLTSAIAAFGKPVLYAMGDLHNYVLDVPYPGQAPLLTRVLLDKGMPGLSVTVTHDPLNPWILDQTP